MALPSRMVCGVEGFVLSLSRTFVGEAWGLVLVCPEECGQVFPRWTVSHHIWQTALRPDVSGIVVDARLFHEAGCRLVHRYQVYKDPFPHPAVRGDVVPRLLSCVNRAMAIARLTHLRISIPAS